MSGSQTGSKLADSLRRAKTQQDTDNASESSTGPASVAEPKPAVKPKAAPKKRRVTAKSKESTPGLKMSSRCWPD